MASRTVVCPDCDEPLTYGRLSCGNCGSLLASVAGAPPRAMPLRTVTIEEPSWLSDDDDPGWMVEDGAVASLPRTEPPTWSPLADTDAVAVTSTEADAQPALEPASPYAVTGGDEPEPEATAEPDDEPEATAEPARATEAVPDPEGSPDVEPAPEPDDTHFPAPIPGPASETGAIPDEPPETGAPADLDDAAEPQPADIVPARAQLGRWPADQAPDATAAARAPTAPARVPRPPVTGRSRLDLTAPPPAPMHPSDEATSNPPAGSWLPPALDPSTPAMAGPAAASLSARAAPKPRPGDAPLLADLPLDAPNTIAGWLVAVGSALATLGFVLPWANAIPFATGSLGYTDRWGLAV